MDYNETFSPVVKHSTIRLVLSLAVSKKWTRSLYGLKQAPRALFRRFSDYLLQLGFEESLCDYSLFVFNQRGVYLILLIYVDDILLTGNNDKQMQWLIEKLGTLFSMKDLGPLSYFLGVEVTYSGENMHLTQSKYALDLLERTKFTAVKPVSTHVPAGQKLSQYVVEPYSNPEQYRTVIGALQYLTITIPDLSYAVNQVCQFMHMPRTTHWTAVKRILRYLKATHDHGLVYKPGDVRLNAFSDADYAGNPDTRHSTGGFCIYLGTNLISWSSKKQKTVSRSSTEAEYRQLAYTAAELSWLGSLF
ncbi:uncharacterized mitochondrial protein AtMg00810-like [Malus sylvestris]|uniref:uncharacterized mitochondrial protein AtMg00810-like n=1 Tax=Malus domestica TaxID=3750 RepID=UPI0010AAC1FA|nr:uncharacterized protein LOC108173348 [Malus domestica]XP_050147490.1 uncharacterized mitochondrial protein AtMg00810-like [Malus sylvestris]